MNRRQFLQLVSASVAVQALPRGLRAAGEATGGGFSIRGLEFAGSTLWQWRSIDRALDLMGEVGLNTLLIHQNDFPDYIVWPSAFFSADFMYARNPVRTVYTVNARNYVREVGRRAARRGIKLILEDKEIFYPEGLIELHPEVMEVKGIVCPTHPFWWKYLRAKYAELLRQVPEIDGLMISAGSRESQVTFAARNCPCDRCRATAPEDWYANLVAAIREPATAAGKMTVIRDHAYSRAEQSAIVAGCARAGDDVVLSLSNTPQDFYPTFPDNPRLGQTGSNPQWIEFDAMGQFAGMGVFPCSFLENWQPRLARAQSAGAQGVWFRVDLESVTDCSVWDSPNLLNLVGGAQLARRPDANVDRIHAAWQGGGLFNPLWTESEQGPATMLAEADRRRMTDFLRRSTAVLEKSVFVRGLVFTDGTGQFPDSVDRAFDNMLGMHPREDWDPGWAARVAPTRETLDAVVAEKAAAEAEFSQAVTALQLDQMALEPELHRAWSALIALYGRYITGFRLCATACFAARLAKAGHDAAASDQLQSAANALTRFRQELARHLDTYPFPHYVRRMFEVTNLDRLAEDVRRHA